MSKKEVRMVDTAISLLEFLDKNEVPISVGLGSLSMALMMSSRQLHLPKQGVLEALQRTADTIYDDPMWQETMQ